MIIENKMYAVKQPNTAGIYSVELKTGAVIIAALQSNSYPEKTKIFELGEEYEVILNSSLLAKEKK